MTVRGRWCALALAALMLAGMVLSGGFARTGDRSFFLPEQEGYERYENTAVKFALDVPEDYELTEPYENVVLVSDGNDFRLSAEYTFTTADQAHFISSAEDFAAFIEADETVLTDWVGSSDLEILASGWGDVDGVPCYVCAFALTLSGKTYSGALYLFDGQGDFGCYCLQGLLNEDSDKAELYGGQLEHIVKSFTVTGPYQAEGYTFYETRCEGAPVEFFARDGVQVEEYDSWIDIYPEDHAFTEASVGIVQTVYEPADELETVMEAMCTSFFELHDDTRYTAQPSHFDLGRYSYDLAALEYYDEGVRYSVSIALFVSGDHYWRVTAKTTDEYAEQVAAVFSDTLFSLRVNGDVALSGQEEPDGQGELARTAGDAGGVGAVLDVIETQEGFTGGSNGFMAPIGCVTELDGGGRLLAVVYELKDGSGNGELYTVSADAWLIGDGSAVLLARSELYKELGGNSGSVSIARKDGVVYLEMECHLWEGDRFNNYYAYMPLNETEARFDEAVYMEGHGTVGEEDQGQYIVGDDEVTRAGFDDARAAYVFDPGMTLDIQQGPGNGDVMDFDALRHWYPD